jgi:hypothetical protein
MNEVKDVGVRTNCPNRRKEDSAAIAQITPQTEINPRHHLFPLLFSFPLFLSDLCASALPSALMKFSFLNLQKENFISAEPRGSAEAEAQRTQREERRNRNGLTLW